ncbi:hypothetical protein ACMFMG_000292 [Clarireedia jacksonii]
MEPTQKKRKIDSEAPEPKPPIVFRLPTHPPDVKLKIFDTLDFHVHSIILKMHSAFFRKFLDSPEKGSPLTGKWRYEWGTVIDDDGSWSLVDIRNIPADHANDLDGRKSKHEEAFHKFIGIFYGQPWKITDLKEFALVVTMADYYCALPLVSRALNGAFYLSPDFLSTFKDANQRDLLFLAIKLRCADLFRDCMIIIAGNMGNGRVRQTNFEPNLGDPKLDNLALKLRNQIYEKIIAVNQVISHACSVSAGDQQDRVEIEKLQSCHGLYAFSNMSPMYYRAFERHSRNLLIQRHVAFLLQSKLKFFKTQEHKDHVLRGHFLCVDIKDEDIPWDVSEADW